jgi:GNAT superfamily N-acetyltransferase
VHRTDRRRAYVPDVPDRRKAHADELATYPVTPERLDDLADLFNSNGTTRGCWCMFFIASRADFGAGWRGGNRAAFERLVEADPAPPGLLAYREGTPVGWCAVGPRSRYSRAIGPRAVVLRGRDPAEDDSVWLVPCFFVRVGHRGRGVTRALLDAAADLARSCGAAAIEGFPRRAGQGRSPDGYLGTEELFRTCGFDSIALPTPRRAVMRRNLST